MVKATTFSAVFVMAFINSMSFRTYFGRDIVFDRKFDRNFFTRSQIEVVEVNLWQQYDFTTKFGNLREILL